ncbi:ATP-binding cassette transporter, putative [Talaromyces marneffei ATCC 18224]|uniref:ATP-binding cassette transporter, putative n=1 Tax=Talaromyces marneffei (strain ATCC 18224 / CBS 334.59 / QM 7333) TaxID=441960 RepID=B6QJD5_TALMQ|nr:ATP-binding cassette transporter, putative [Talaromyces marneffei ATCC 18224]
MRNCHLIKIRVCLEGIWLLWDSYIKEVVIHQLSRSSSASEEASGVLGRIFFWWIHPVLKEGYKAVLNPENLPEIDSQLLSEGLRARAVRAWATRSEPLNRWTLPFMLVSCLKTAFLLPILSRMSLILFTYLQPIFIGVAINFCKGPTSHTSDTTSADSGLRLVLFSAIVYLGMAVSGPTYQHQINRLRVMTRGALISLVHHQSLHMSTTGSKDSEALTLVSSDIDNIESFGETFHETWARLLEVIIGTMLLAAQIGWFAFLPLVIVFGCSRVSAYVAKHLDGMQKDWNVATQKRLATVAAALGGIKSLKMMGMEDAVQSLISYLRSEEIGSSKRLRWILVTYNASANALGIFAPVLTLILYALTLENGGVLRADEVFTSVALLTMVTHPANMVMTLIPQAIAIMANFDRVQSYVSQPSIQDKREYSAESNVRKLASIQNVSITSPSTSLTLLRDVCIDLNRGEIVICAGAVGSGKTMLAMAILGEAHLTTGTIRVSSKEIAYCSQEPWLPSVTIRDAISGGGLDLDLEWYNTVIDACGLVPDFTTFARGDMTLIENNGINLSGGQKQRIALARAVYSRHRILVLDDPFSAIDGKTVDRIIGRLLSTRGLLKRMATTVFLITNSRKLDSFADKLLVLQDSCIHLRDPSSFEDTEDSSAPSISIDTDNLKSELIETPKPKGVNHRIKDAADDITRATGDIAVYGYYVGSIGRLNALLMSGCTAAYSFCLTFSQYILKWATESPPEKLKIYMALYAAISFIAWVATNGTMWSTQIKIAVRSGTVLHAQLLERVLRAPLSYFTQTDVGAILNRFGQDINLVDKQLPPALANLNNQIFKLLMQLVLLLRVQPIMVVTVPSCFMSVYFIQKIYLRTSRQLRFLDLESRSQLYTSFLDTTSGVTTIRAFGWKEKFKDENIRAIDISQKPFYLLLCLQCWLKVVLDCLMAIIAIDLIALTVMYRNTVTGVDLGLSLNLIILANTTLLRLVQSWTSLETSLGAIARLKNIQESVPSQERDPYAVDPGPRWPSLGDVRLEEVSASYSQSLKLALRNVSLSINPGQKLIVVGRTGSGKSTLMLTLLQLLNTRQGSIWIDDVDITQIPLRTLRQRGFIAVPQDGFNVPSASLRFNLDPYHMNSEEDIVMALKRVGIWERIWLTYGDPTCETAGASADVGRLLDSPISLFLPFSAGQLQLFALCRTLLRVKSNALTKPIIILDEASSSLDPETESILVDLLRDDLRDHTVVIIAHRLEGFIKAMRPGIDAIVTMKDGQLQKLSLIGSQDSDAIQYTVCH